VRSAQERVASFLLEMADRTAAAGPVVLPMSRRDIADYLGLTIETVSRALTALEGQSAITMTGARRVQLTNMRELRRLDS
jgi:CRP/FNR family transcriptional regulator, nitrogen fixation regulation protein